MGKISYDSRTGKLTGGLIWEFTVAGSLETAMENDCAHGEWNGTEQKEDLYLCPVSRKHKTGTRWRHVEIDLFGGPHTGDFLPLVNHGFNIVSHAFAERLQGSGLKGFSIREGVRIAVNQSDIKDPRFYFLDVVGKGGTCNRWRIDGAANSCPYCGREPVICPGCGWCSEYGCPDCGKQVHYFRPADSDGKRLLYEGYPRTLIVKGNQWDGSDWFAVEGHGGSWFVNRHAKEWFEEAQVLGGSFKAAFLDLEGAE